MMPLWVFWAQNLPRQRFALKTMLKSIFYAAELNNLPAAG
jgi:hypothetical protein